MFQALDFGLLIRLPLPGASNFKSRRWMMINFRSIVRTWYILEKRPSHWSFEGEQGLRMPFSGRQMLLRIRLSRVRHLPRDHMVSRCWCFKPPALSSANFLQIGKVDSLGSYGTVVLVAGGIGITHPVPFLRDLVEGYANGTIATRRVVLVWIVQSPGKAAALIKSLAIYTDTPL